jgi:hypothetical protein
MLVGAGLQLFFLDRGFLSISWDEAGRTLDAYTWAEHGRGSGSWLPFYRVIVGLTLRIFPDLIVTPRVISGLFGLAAIPAMGWVAHELFEDRRSTLLTLAIGALFSQRVALSVAPVSAIMFIVFVLCGLALFAHWLRTGRSSALYACAGSVAIAGTERFEAWLFGAAILLAVWFHPQRPNFKRLLPFVVILFIFPVGMLAYYVLRFFNPFAAVVRDARQFSLPQILLKNPLSDFVIGNSLCLNLAGLAVIIPLIRRGDPRYRYFAAAAFVPLAVISVGLLLASSAQTGPSWRMVAIWSMLLLPFTAHFLIGLAQWRPSGRGLTAVAVAILCTAFLYDAFRIERESSWAFPESDRAAGAYIKRFLETSPDTRIQIESHYTYLNVLLASQHPNAFILSTVPDIANDRASLFLFQTPESTNYLARQTVLIHRFGPWSLYCLRETKCPDNSYIDPVK